MIARLRENGIDSLLVTRPENIYYLTSFAAENIYLVISEKCNFAVTDFIYGEAAAKNLKGLGIEVLLSEKGSPVGEILRSRLRRHRIGSIGVEARHLDSARFFLLKKYLKGKGLVRTEDIVESLREIKDAGEIIALKKAVKVTRDVFRTLKGSLRPDSSEAGVAGLAKEGFIKNGADGPSFEPIIAGQPCASQPHYIPKRVRLGDNKLILADIGCKLSYYNSDLTRMCPLGKISSKFAKLYSVILDAQRHAIERVKPGAKISDIDAAARQHIDSKGLGRFFGHNTGHGIGLEVHEPPVISGYNKNALKEDMVFTIEPGIYIPGYGGLRIEDMIRVTRQGYEILTNDIDKSI